MPGSAEEGVLKALAAFVARPPPSVTHPFIPPDARFDQEALDGYVECVAEASLDDDAFQEHIDYLARRTAEAVDYLAERYTAALDDLEAGR